MKINVSLQSSLLRVCCCDGHEISRIALEIFPPPSLARNLIFSLFLFIARKMSSNEEERRTIHHLCEIRRYVFLNEKEEREERAEWSENVREGKEHVNVTITRGFPCDAR